MGSSVEATQPSVELILTTLRKRKPNCRNRLVAPPSSEMGLFDDAQRDSLPVGCTTETHFKDGVLQTGLAIRDGLQNFPFGALPLSNRLCQCSSKRLEYVEDANARHNAMVNTNEEKVYDSNTTEV